MKKMLVVLVVTVLASLPLFGQATAPAVGSFALGIGLEGGVPTGDFSNVSNFGIGGLATGRYVVDDNLSASLKVGYLNFSGKDQTVLGVTISGVSEKVIPILVGGRYFFTPTLEETAMRVYGAADAGLFMLSNGSSTSKFGLAPILGAQFKAGDNMNVDIHANYTFVFTDVSTTSWVGMGIGLEFGLQP